MRRNDATRNAGQGDLDALRSWYAKVQQRIQADSAFEPGDVIASLAAMARPFVSEVAAPTKEQRQRNPGRYIQARAGRWFERLPTGPTGTGYDGPLDPPPRGFVMSFDRAGAYVWSDGRTRRDRERVLAAHDVDGWARQLLEDVLPSGRAIGARKGAQPRTVARALVLWSLRSRIGLRPAARLVIAWDDELKTDYAAADAASLMRRYDAGGDLTNGECRRRMALESTVISTSRRIWDTVGLTSKGSSRI